MQEHYDVFLTRARVSRKGAKQASRSQRTVLGKKQTEWHAHDVF